VSSPCHVQRRRFQAGLLQCTVESRTGGDCRQTTARPEQPGQKRLPEPGPHRRQAAASLATLTVTSGEAAGHWLYRLIRCGPQPFQRILASWYRPMHHLGLYALPMLRCSSFLAYTPNWPVALFLLLLHPPATLYLLTFDTM